MKKLNLKKVDVNLEQENNERIRAAKIAKEVQAYKESLRSGRRTSKYDNPR